MKKKGRTADIIPVLVKCLLAVWAISGDSLSLMLTAYPVDVPVVKQILMLLEFLDGWGLENLFMALGLGAVFYLVRDRQKNVWVSGLSAFFSVCTVIGISYGKTGSWDCLFLYGMQFALAVFVAAGYYLIYKNGILLVALLFESRKDWLRDSPRGKWGNFLFERHAFLAPFLFALLFGVPWLVAFCPGTLQWDAHAQLWMSLGASELTSYHPVFMSQYMGGCIRLGRLLFGSDSVGLFLFTFPQFICQCLVFAYALWTMSKIKAPVLFRWSALVFWAVLPYFPLWGYTMVKDTSYYIAILLLTVLLTDVLSGKGRTTWWRYVLMAASAAVIALSRNEGRYVAVITLSFALLAYRKYWKLFLTGLGACVFLLVVEEGVYMPARQIGKGPVGEMLSVPLQQTARFLRDHYEDAAPEELRVLQQGFDIEIGDLGSYYDPLISDSVKGHFVKNPDSGYLRAYVKVWLQQFLKHPDTYVQAFLNHIYGYFYPDYPNYGDYLIFSYIGNSDHWQDGYLDIQVAVKDGRLRDILRHYVYLLEKTPVLSMMFSCGAYTYILFGGAVYLLANGRKKELVVLVPEFCVLLFCMLSPVNGFLRYCMPIMVTVPIQVSWEYCVCRREAADIGEMEDRDIEKTEADLV